MANENVKEFEELLRSDEELQAKLRAAMDAYEGAKDDAQAFFDATVSKLAEEAGLPFTYEDAREFSLAEAELNDAELEAVAGGWGMCFTIGYGDVDAAACENWSVNFGAGACGGIGVGFKNW